jgi:fatty acid desaturase
LICFLFTLLHETVHRTPFKTDTLNIWVSRLCGFLTFLGPEWFRYFHFAHHRYTHDPDNDPELLSPKPQTLWQYITYLSGLPDWRDRCLTLVRNAIRHNDDSYVPARGKAKVMREARVQLALYGAIIALSVAFQTALLIKIWLLPILLGGPFLRLSLSGTCTVRARPIDAREHAYNADKSRRALHCVEHALSRRASRLSLCSVS